MEKPIQETAASFAGIDVGPRKNTEKHGEVLGYPEENAEIIVALAEQGLNSERIIGYHGTSLEALQEALKTGSVRGAMKGESQVGEMVDPEHSFFFFPIKEKFEGHPDVEKFRSDRESSEGAEMYAQLLAGAHFLLKDIGMGITDKAAVEYAKSIILWEGFAFNFSANATDAIEYFKGKGIEKRDLMKRAERAAKRKGVVLGINDTVKETYQLVDPQQDEGDLSLQIPEGLPLNALAGVEPLSQEEWDFFMELQGELKKKRIAE
jgi:hypothetical protein